MFGYLKLVELTPNKRRKALLIKKQPAVDENIKVAGLLTGYPSLGLWTAASALNQTNSNGDLSAEKEHHSTGLAVLDFYQTKGIVENLFDYLRIDLHNLRFSNLKSAPPLMHPSKSAQIDFVSADNKATLLGWLGELHPAWAEKLALDPNTYLFEIETTALEKLRKEPVFKPIVISPAIVRDLTIDLNKSIEHAAVAACIQNSAGKYLVATDLISLFALDNEKASLSYRLTFQHPEETLRSEAIDKFLEDIRKALKENCPLRLELSSAVFLKSLHVAYSKNQDQLSTLLQHIHSLLQPLINLHQHLIKRQFYYA